MKASKIYAISEMDSKNSNYRFVGGSPNLKRLPDADIGYAKCIIFIHLADIQNRSKNTEFIRHFKMIIGTK